MNLSEESIKYLDNMYMYLENAYYYNKKSSTRRHLIKLLNYKLKKYKNNYKYKDNHKMLIKYKK